MKGFLTGLGYRNPIPLHTVDFYRTDRYTRNGNFDMTILRIIAVRTKYCTVVEWSFEKTKKKVETKHGSRKERKRLQGYFFMHRTFESAISFGPGELCYITTTVLLFTLWNSSCSSSRTTYLPTY